MANMMAKKMKPKLNGLKMPSFKNKGLSPGASAGGGSGPSTPLESINDDIGTNIISHPLTGEKEDQYEMKSPTTPQISNKGSSGDGNNIAVTNMETIESDQLRMAVGLIKSPTEDDSIMGMSTENLLDSQEEEEEGDNDSLDNDGSSIDPSLALRESGLSASALSDEDYYRQDYFMLAKQMSSASTTKSGESGDDNLAIAVSSSILDEMNGSGSDNNNNKQQQQHRFSAEEIDALTRPDTPMDNNPAGNRSRGDGDGGNTENDNDDDATDYHDFYVDAENPLDLAAAPAQKDYRTHFEKMLSTKEDNHMPVLPRDEEFHEQYNNAKKKKKSSGAAAAEKPMQLQPKDEKIKGSETKKKNAPLSSATTSAQDPPKIKVIAPSSETSSTSSHTTRGGHTRTSSRDEWFPFPASSPTNSLQPPEGTAPAEEQVKKPEMTENNKTNNILEEEEEHAQQRMNDFATSIKQARAGLQSTNNDADETPKTPRLSYHDEEESDPDKSPVSIAGDGTQNSPDHKAMMEIIHKFANTQIPPSPDDDNTSGSMNTPPASSSSGSGGVESKKVAKLLKENTKLRKRRKELLALLSSTAQQFSSYERICTQKISKLEQKNQMLQRSPEEVRDLQLAVSSASSFSEELSSNNNESRGNSGTNNIPSTTTATTTKKYDSEIVRRLSNGVLMQEKQLKAKDELITQLKLRCEVLKQSNADKDAESHQEKKIWEDERTKLLEQLETSSPVKQSHGELLAAKMENTRLKQDLETALDDITMLTTALETNNEALDATVVELDKLQEWKLQYGEQAAAAAAASGDGSSSDVKQPPPRFTTDVDTLRSEMKEKDEEITQLQLDLESSLNEIEELRAEMNKVAELKGYNDFVNMIEDLRVEVKACKSDAVRSEERIARLEAELEEKKGEIEQLTAKSLNAAAEPHEQLNGVSYDKSSEIDGAIDSNADEGNASAESPLADSQGVASTSRIGGKRLFGRLPFGVRNSNEPADFPTMLRQRDLKIKSLEAMIFSNSKIVEKMKLDVERIDTEKSEAEHISSHKIEKLEEENKTYEMQVAGFEKAFMTLNEQRGSEILRLSQDNDEIVDGNMFDEDDVEEEDSEKLRSKNSALQRMVTELQSSGSFQEDQIERLKAELVKLRVVSQHDKESALGHLSEENKIIKAQRSALENQLVEINKSAGMLRDSISPPTTPADNGNGSRADGSDPILVAQVVMLENANKVLESSVDSLRSDMHEKLAPLLEKIALLEEEKKMSEEEMKTKLDCREMTIKSLEESLQGLQRATRLKYSKKKG